MTDFAIDPPVEPMLAKLAETLPEGGTFSTSLGRIPGDRVQGTRRRLHPEP